MNDEERLAIWQRALGDARQVAARISEESADDMDPKLVEHRRMSAVAGRAKKDRVVEVNLSLVRDGEQYEETVYHELAHVICWRVYGPDIGHGACWKHIMAELGQDPERCHKIDMCSVMPEKFQYAICTRCGKRVSVSRKIADRILAGRKYVCRVCKGDLKIP